MVQAAVRETKEETGIDCEITGLAGIYTDPKHVILSTGNGEVRQEFPIVLTARATGGAPSAVLRAARCSGCRAMTLTATRWTGRCGCASVISTRAARDAPGLIRLCLDWIGEQHISQCDGEQGHGAAVLDRLQLAGVTGQDHLGAACLGQTDHVGQVGGGDHRGFVDQQQGVLADIERAAGAALAGQVTQELGRVVGLGHAGGQGVAGGLRGRDPDDWSSGAAQMRAASVITRVLPDPAGALITETRLPSVSTDSTAAACSAVSRVRSG